MKKKILVIVAAIAILIGAGVTVQKTKDEARIPVGGGSLVASIPVGGTSTVAYIPVGGTSMVAYIPVGGTIVSPTSYDA